MYYGIRVQSGGGVLSLSVTQILRLCNQRIVEGAPTEKIKSNDLFTRAAGMYDTYEYLHSYAYTYTRTYGHGVYTYVCVNCLKVNPILYIWIHYINSTSYPFNDVYAVIGYLYVLSTKTHRHRIPYTCVGTYVHSCIIRIAQ